MTKKILFVLTLTIVVGLFSFKTSSTDSSPNTILISILNGTGENAGFIITYGDGKRENRPFNTKLKTGNIETWVQLQLQAATILNEFKEKGYHFVGTHKFWLETMVLEKD